MLFRSDTFDSAIYHSVFKLNEYNLPSNICKPVIDIGAHIGSFALAALSRGAPIVVCYEPEPDNFKLLSKNLEAFVQSGRAVLHNAAVGLKRGSASYTKAKDVHNTGGGVVDTRVSGSVKVLAAKQVFSQFDTFLLKLDCEGSEYEIAKEPTITKAYAIVGEYHNGKRPILPHVHKCSVAHTKELGFFTASHAPDLTYCYPYAQDVLSGYGRVSHVVTKTLGLRSVKGNAVLGLAPADFRLGAHIRMATWESTKLPTLYGIEPSSVLVVPCAHNVTALRASGYRGRIELLPQWGDLPFSHLPAHRPFKFICIARDNNVPTRKGIDELIAWFTEAFPTQSDVELTIKQSPYCKRRYTYDKRITIIYEDYDRTKYQDLIAKHHCGIFLSGAEAWNFPACELMSAGRPSIIIPFGGPADFTTAKTSWHLPYKLIKAPIGVYKAIGEVAYPYKDGTIQAMQEAYSDQLLLAEKAVASARMSHEYTEARFAQRLRDIVRKYA